MIEPRILALQVALAATLCPGSFAQTGATDFDLLIENGRIVDGTGNPWYYGDVGIVGDTIVELGDLSGRKAERTIDAVGLVVCPGFRAAGRAKAALRRGAAEDAGRRRLALVQPWVMVSSDGGGFSNVATVTVEQLREWSNVYA